MEIVRSKLLGQFSPVVFGMSTAHGGISSGKFGLNLSFNVNDNPESVKQNRKLFFDSLGISEEQIAFTRQQHTTNINSVQTSGMNDNCDALFTNAKNVYLAISIADCTPVMLFDKRNNVIAGAHAGWKGTAGRIVEKTIRKMNEQFGSKGADMVAFIGPSAGKCCYEVGNEVAKLFPSECSTQKDNGKWMLDVKQANMLQLLENGVVISNIDVHPDCTIHNSKYHSFRRDGNESGRMFAIIGIKS